MTNDYRSLSLSLQTRSSRSQLISSVIGHWEFTGHWSLVIGHFLSLFLLCGSFLARAFAGETPAISLLPNAQVTSEGVFLSQTIATNSPLAELRIRLSDAPRFGQSMVL